MNKNEMKILYLPIKQKYFDAIMAGRKVQEFREVRPTTIKKLLQLDADGYEIVDEDENAQPIMYDAILFAVGYSKDRDTALVEVENSHCEIFIDKDGKPIEYEYENQIWVAEQVVYDLGKVLEHNIREKSKRV